MSLKILHDPSALRLVWPQWQGAARENYPLLFSELPENQARRGYARGTEVLQSILPPAAGPSATVPVATELPSDDIEGGIENRSTLLHQLEEALRLLDGAAPERIITIGGECSVSVAPFSWLKKKYGDDLAVIWVDSHPDIGTPASEYPGYHAMAVSNLLGKVDDGFSAALPAHISPDKLALAGLNSWTDDDIGNVQDWSLKSFSPADLAEDSTALLEWLKATGASKVAIHFDVDAVTSKEVALGLGLEENGMSAATVHRILHDIGAAADVVGLTIAEFIPRNVMFMDAILGEAKY